MIDILNTIVTPVGDISLVIFLKTYINITILPSVTEKRIINKQYLKLRHIMCVQVSICKRFASNMVSDRNLKFSNR